MLADVLNKEVNGSVQLASYSGTTLKSLQSSTAKLDAAISSIFNCLHKRPASEGRIPQRIIPHIKAILRVFIINGIQYSVFSFNESKLKIVRRMCNVHVKLS